MKSNKTACIVTAAVIVLSAVLGCNRSLAALKGRTERMLTDGGETGYCVATDGEDMVNTARNLVTVAEKYLPADQGLLRELEAYCGQMEDAGRSVDERLNAARGIRSVADSVAMALEETGAVSEKDRGYLAGFDADLDSAMHRMERDPFNKAARAFNEVEKSFPANVLGFLVGPMNWFEF